MNDDRPWYAFTKSEIIIDTLLLTAAYRVFGTPHGLLWITMPIGLLVGKALIATPGFFKARTRR